MAISFVGAQANAGTTVTIPTHQSGDLILIFAYRDGNNTAPTTPTAGGTVPTWNLIGSSGANSNSSNFRWARATASTTTSGTWTNATELICLVYRTASIGTSAGAGAGATTTINYPALTLQRTDGSSWVVGVAGHRSATNVELAPSGMTNRTSTGSEAAGHDTNGGVTTWASTNVTVNASNAYRSWTVELRDTSLELIHTTASFTLTGNNLDLNRQFELNLTNGSFNDNGINVDLLFNRQLINQLGEFSFAGINNTLLVNRLLEQQLGTYALDGVNVDLQYTPISVAFTLDALTRQFVLTGYPIDLNLQKSLSLTTGTYALTGIQTQFNKQFLLQSNQGVFVLNSFPVNVNYNSIWYLIPAVFNTRLQSNGDFFWYRTTQTIKPVKYRITKRNEWILGRATHMGRRGL